MTDNITGNGQLRIRNAKDVLDALRSPDPGMRVSILRAVIRNPEKAAAYGTCEGQDIVDELCSQAESLGRSPLRMLVLSALSGYRDRRVREFFRKEVNIAEDAETITIAARYLAGEPEDDVKETLSGLLLQDNSPTHARAAADVMADFEQLSLRERIRIAMLSDRDFAPPVLDSETGPAWSEELGGPYGPHARRLIEAQGEPAFLSLRKSWDFLSDTDKKWLLEWGSAGFPAYTVELILRVLASGGLDSGPDPVVSAALEAICRLGAAGSIFSSHVSRYLKSPVPELRLAAVRAGAACADWEAALAAEEDISVRMEMMIRLTEEKGTGAAPALIRLIEEGDFRLRAAAAVMLQELGKDVSEIVKPLLEHPQQGVRVAAAQVLINAGEELWLEERILS